MKITRSLTRHRTYLDHHISTTFPTPNNPSLPQDMYIPIYPNPHHIVRLIQR